MSNASGAACVDTSKTWTPDGLKKKAKFVDRNCDSYLLRYQEKMKKNKTTLLQGRQDNPGVTDQGNDGAEEEKLPENGGSEDLPSEKPASGENLKKSVLCVLL